MRGEETRREIVEQPELMRRAFTILSTPARYAAETLAGRSFIYTIGEGPSLHPAVLLRRALARSGGPQAIYMSASELPSWLPDRPKSPAMVAFSETGEEREILEAVTVLRRRSEGAPVVSILGSPGSSLHRISDFALVFASGPRRMGLFSPMAMAGLLLVSELSRLIGMSARAVSLRRELESTPDLASEALQRAEKYAEGIARAFQKARSAFVVAEPPLLAAAMEFAFRLSAFCEIPVEVSSPSEFLATKHRTVSEGTPVLVLEPERIPEVVPAAERYGAEVVEVGPSGPDLPLGVEPGREVASLVYAPTLLLLVLEIALIRGLDPDEMEAIMYE